MEERDGVTRIADERRRQREAEGYTEAHDDEEHEGGEIAMAAACYAAPEYIYTKHEHANGVGFTNPWPWGDQYDKRPRPSRGNFVEPERATDAQRIRLLEKAGALCAAEIDRLLRVKRKQKSA